jgi:hypothetical protein
VNDDAARVWQGLRALVHERYDRRKEVSDALGMSFVRAKALRYLTADGPMSMRRLATALATDAPYTTLVVEDLVSRGLVERTEDPADRRAKIVRVTGRREGRGTRRSYPQRAAGPTARPQCRRPRHARPDRHHAPERSS